MSQIRVVVSDDHHIVRSGICNLLGNAPDIVVVGEAGDGEEAMAKTRALMPDLLLLDMEMPQMDGVEVAKQLKKEALPVKILALSAYDSVHFIQSILDAGAYGYLTKEEMPDKILEAVRGVAAGKSGWLSDRAKERMKKYLTSEGDPLAKISRREQEILKLVCEGCDNLTIAEVLNISDRTVRNHTSNIYKKLGFGTRAEVVAWAWEIGLFQ